MTNISLSFDSLEQLVQAKQKLETETTGLGMALGDYPLLNILKTNEGAILEAQVPGLTKENINVDVHNNRVLIEGKLPEPRQCKDGYFVHKETTEQKLFRSIELPFEIDQSKMELDFWNGILTIKLPRQ